jgi:hypothetical protein
VFQAAVVNSSEAVSTGVTVGMGVKVGKTGAGAGAQPLKKMDSITTARNTAWMAFCITLIFSYNFVAFVVKDFPAFRG